MYHKLLFWMWMAMCVFDSNASSVIVPDTGNGEPSDGCPIEIKTFRGNLVTRLGPTVYTCREKCVQLVYAYEKSEVGYLAPMQPKASNFTSSSIKPRKESRSVRIIRNRYELVRCVSCNIINTVHVVAAEICVS